MNTAEIEYITQQRKHGSCRNLLNYAEMTFNMAEIIQECIPVFVSTLLNAHLYRRITPSVKFKYFKIKNS